LARPDAQVFPPAAEGHLGLRLPFPGVADSHPGAESLSDVDRDAVLQACPDMVGAIPEARQGPMAVDAEILVDRAPRPADAVQAHPDPAWAVCLALPASVALVERSAEPRAAVVPCKRDAALSAA